MNRMTSVLFNLLAIFTLFFTNLSAYAGDAEVLPKGRFAFNVDFKHYLDWDKRYDKNGNEQNAASDFNTVLDTSVFSALTAFNGMVPGTPNIGTSVTSFNYSYDRIDTSLAYGISDTVSFGVKIPYIWYKNEVRVGLDTSKANVGINNLYKAGVLPPDYDSLPLLPLGAPFPAGTVTPLTTKDVQNLLGTGLAINGQLAVPGYGFKPFETWEKEGLGDIEAGVKYQFYKNENWRLAAQGGVLFPTGAKDDPDNLVDRNLGGGSYAVQLKSYNDYIGIKNMVFNGSLFYSIPFTQHADKRITADPHEVLVPISKKVRCQITPGNVIEVETSAKYKFNDVPVLEGFSLEGLYHYTYASKSEVKDPSGNRVPGLEGETDGYEHIYMIKLGYSTIPLFVQKKFPLPLDMSVSFRDKFAGNNSTFKTQYLQATATLYF